MSQFNGFRGRFVPRKPKFVIDQDVKLSIEFDTAVDLGEFILAHMPKDATGRADHPPIYELGRRLASLNGENEFRQQDRQGEQQERQPRMAPPVLVRNEQGKSTAADDDDLAFRVTKTIRDRAESDDSGEETEGL